MYGLPEDFDGSFLVGRTLELVCFAQYQVRLHFGPDVDISIESSFEYGMRDRRSLVDRPNVKTSWLMKFLGLSVSSVAAARDGTLTLRFEDDSWITCYDPTPQYEAYRIRNGDSEIRV